MNFYKHHLGDYDGATSHLSWDEDMAYTRLLRVYYRREQPITDAEKYRLCRATSKAQRAAVDRVLGEFFSQQEDGWHNKRADEEVSAYKAQAETNRRIATNRERARNESLTNRPPVTSGEREPNHKPEPLTTNQKPDVISKVSAYSEVPTRVSDARALLEKHQVNFDETWLAVWEGYGVERIEKAIAIAKGRLKGGELRATYLDTVLSDDKNFNGSGANGHEKPWFIRSSTAIEAKGEELGLKPEKGEHFPYYKDRVFKAAGITEDMVRKAEADYRGRA